MRQLTAIAAFVSSIGAVRISVTHVIQVDAQSSLALEFQVRTLRNGLNSRKEKRLREAQEREFFHPVRTIRQTVVTQVVLMNFSSPGQSEESSLFARSVLTTLAVYYTVFSNERNEEKEINIYTV